MDRVELVDQGAGPVVEHVRDRNRVGDAEGEVQIGEPVGGVDGQRAHDGSRDHALVRLREHEHAPPESIPLLHGEHGAMLGPATGVGPVQCTSRMRTNAKPSRNAMAA